MWLFYAPDIEQTNELPQAEAVHAVRVLRLKEGDEISVTDGKGYMYKAVLTACSPKRCLVHITERSKQPDLWKGQICVAVAPTKMMDRNEWFVEKAVEIGVDRISFMKTCNSERCSINSERIERIAVSAMKQSYKATLPQFDNMISFNDIVKTPFDGVKCIAHLEPGRKQLLQDVLTPNTNALVLIGPEGDFSPSEIEMALANGFEPVSLGPSRLRTETAALVACHIANLKNQIG
ncbi:MAG: 16S rRNA (uracil(1498)-N(3))-methyltransferase [Bacteroidaceae bacterium]|nr:16S rRNA (uracil(1498)-N(3))-methyltransferase [Bacteroidaceae bacterium]